MVVAERVEIAHGRTDQMHGLHGRTRGAALARGESGGEPKRTIRVSVSPTSPRGARDRRRRHRCHRRHCRRRSSRSSRRGAPRGLGGSEAGPLAAAERARGTGHDVKRHCGGAQRRRYLLRGER